MLTKENFIKARDYIFANSDDVNRAWFRYIFEGNDTDKFMEVLSRYQHENGGFGGIFYEFDYQGPCLKSTEIAIGYILNLREKPAAEHVVIQKMMGYILSQYLPNIGNWGDPAVPEVNEGVHCHWVRFRNEDFSEVLNEDEKIKGYCANEKACFAAFVALYPEIVPDELCRNILKYPTEHLLRYWNENSAEYDKEILSLYDFEYFQWFVSCVKDDILKNKLTEILRQNPTSFMELDFAKSDNEYVHLPCDWIDSPDNVIYAAVKDLVNESLEWRIKQQADDGRWPLGWSMGDGEEFRKLQVKYEAWITMKMLGKLYRFGLIEDMI